MYVFAICTSILLAFTIYFFKLGFNSAKMMQAITEPIAMDARYRSGLPIVGTTKIPPCGARSVHSKNMDNAPAVPAPMMQAGNTRTGSAAANGIAPSVMKERPMM